MGEVRLSAQQVSAVAMWGVAGSDFVPLTILDTPPAYAVEWQDGDVLVTQGDSFIQVSRLGQIKASVPAIAADLR